jgi:hypothetical protein
MGEVTVWILVADLESAKSNNLKKSLFKFGCMIFFSSYDMEKLKYILLYNYFLPDIYWLIKSNPSLIVYL